MSGVYGSGILASAKGQVSIRYPWLLIVCSLLCPQKGLDYWKNPKQNYHNGGWYLYRAIGFLVITSFRAKLTFHSVFYHSTLLSFIFLPTQVFHYTGDADKGLGMGTVRTSVYILFIDELNPGNDFSSCYSDYCTTCGYTFWQNDISIRKSLPIHSLSWCSCNKREEESLLFSLQQ